ncbi:variant 3, Protein POLLEN DEFTIVE IN GUIDANCE 1 [Lathyrus oleraceus]|uniref:Variant 3, Protein POLLEN DEFTIVE IN GUIDANCE 1 n=1 Tax=Pisum sativum TaxID=3888 RepID=A0A9D4VNH9_PEA|nr:variant 3, Protein POLLEN DEFTIVE IN GUIDANCE 1 [Pisum sativum]
MEQFSGYSIHEPTSISSLSVDAQGLQNQIDQLSGFFDAPAPAVTRVLYTHKDVLARRYVKNLMGIVGLSVREDVVGNIFGHWGESEPELAAAATTNNPQQLVLPQSHSCAHSHRHLTCPNFKLTHASPYTQKNRHKINLSHRVQFLTGIRTAISDSRGGEQPFFKKSPIRTGRNSYASSCHELNNHVHYAVTEMPSSKPLRQRSVNSGGSFGDSAVTAVDGGCEKEGSSVGAVTSETVEPLELKRLLTEESILTVKKSPVAYFLEKVGNGNSLWNTTTLGDEKGKERVYDTIFRLPWRCELLIDVGFFVCFNSFLSLLTVMPTRVVMIFWKLLKTRKFKRLSTVELSDFGCFVIMACGITVLQQIDISLIYHIIRGQATIKLYVIYNVLEVFDKLCQTFNGDVLQMLFHSADGLARCPPEMRSNYFISLHCCSLQCTSSFAGVK